MFPVVFWIFLAIVTVRPGGIPPCPTGSYYNQVTKACVQLIDDRNLDRSEPSQPEPQRGETDRG